MKAVNLTKADFLNKVANYEVPQERQNVKNAV